jgi:hypothetical protein
MTDEDNEVKVAEAVNSEFRRIGLTSLGIVAEVSGISKFLSERYGPEQVAILFGAWYYMYLYKARAIGQETRTLDIDRTCDRIGRIVVGDIKV